MYNAYISDKNGMSERRKKVKKKALYKKWMSMLLAGVVTTTGFMGGTVTLRAAETTNWVGDEGLSGTADAPKPDDVVPDANQFRYQKEELAAFCHFGPNTFNEIEWGEHYGDKAPSEIFKLKKDFDAEGQQIAEDLKLIQYDMVAGKVYLSKDFFKAHSE